MLEDGDELEKAVEGQRDEGQRDEGQRGEGHTPGRQFARVQRTPSIKAVTKLLQS